MFASNEKKTTGDIPLYKNLTGDTADIISLVLCFRVNNLTENMKLQVVYCLSILASVYFTACWLNSVVLY